MRPTPAIARSSLLRGAFAVTAATLVTFSVTAQQASSSGIAVEQPWARAAVQGGVGGAFMRIENRGTASDRLVSATSPAARTVELHTTVRDGDVMRMRPVQAIEVPAQGAVQLQPGGLHMMLIGLNQPLKQGEHVPVTLTFERAGTVTIDLAVQAAGAGGMAPMGGTAGHGATGGHPAPQR